MEEMEWNKITFPSLHPDMTCGGFIPELSGHMGGSSVTQGDLGTSTIIYIRISKSRLNWLWRSYISSSTGRIALIGMVTFPYILNCSLVYWHK